MARTLTKKRRGFVNDYADTGNATDAAQKNFNVKDRGVARRVGSELLTFPDVKAELEKLGFDSNNAKRVVGEILNNDGAEHRDRLKAGELVFKVHGDLAPEKHIIASVEVEATPEIKRLTEVLNGIHRGTSVGSDGGPASPVGEEAPNQERTGTPD